MIDCVKMQTEAHRRWSEKREREKKKSFVAHILFKSEEPLTEIVVELLKKHWILFENEELRNTEESRTTKHDPNV